MEREMALDKIDPTPDLEFFRAGIDLIKKASESAVMVVLVWKPAITASGSNGPDYPDVIMTNSMDPAMVRALLGNSEDSSDE